MTQQVTEVGEYGSLNELDPRRLRHFNVWLSAGGLLREGLGGVVLLEEVCHWGGLGVFESLCQA